MEEGVGEVADVVDGKGEGGIIVEMGVGNREPPSSGGSGLHGNWNWNWVN